MIKKFSNTNYNNDYPQSDYYKHEPLYKEIVHIISSLYKIKEIDRKTFYDEKTLRNLVLKNKIGLETIYKLKKAGVNRAILLDYELYFFNRILGDQFDIK